MLYSRFSVAVVLSLLLHLLLLLALYQQDVAAPVLQPAKAAPLTVQIISPPQQRPKPETTATKAPQKSAATTRQEKAKAKPKPKLKQPPTMVKTAKPQRKNAAPAKASRFATASSASTKPVAAMSTTEPAAKQATTASIEPGIANRILNTVAAQQQQQAGQLSSEEVQALWQKPAINVRRDGPKPAYAADNVLEVMADGSFIEKVGDYCYQAKDGADLRRDIASMKPVPCGKDANEALYNSIMNNIGK